MERKTGQYVTISNVGEKCQAFLPESLPFKPELALYGNLRELLDRTLLALGRLDVKAVVAKNATAQIKGGREAIRQIEYYNLRLFPLSRIVFSLYYYLRITFTESIS